MSMGEYCAMLLEEEKYFGTVTARFLWSGLQVFFKVKHVLANTVRKQSCCNFRN